MRLNQAMEARLARPTRTLDVTSTRLQGLDPRAILQRGYSITRDQEGRVIREAATVEPGTAITTQLATGQLHSRVESTPRPTPARSNPKPPPADDPDQMDLFDETR